MSRYRSLSKSSSIALKALGRNKLQTILTMVGMTIGVATVLTMFALGTGAETAIQTQVRAAGMNVVLVKSGNYRMAQQWTDQDQTEEVAGADPNSNTVISGSESLGTPAQRDANPIRDMQRAGKFAAGRGSSDKLGLDDAAEVEKLGGVQYVSGGVGDNANVTYGDTSWFTRVHGEDVGLPAIRRAWIFPHGRFFNRSEVKNAEDVAVIGSVVSERLFGTADPVGKSITVRGRAFKVIGVVASGSWMVPASRGDDQFDAVYIPVTSAMALLNRKSLSTLTVSTASTGDVTKVSKSITSLLRDRHGLVESDPDDFEVASQAHKSLSKGGMRTDIARAVVGNTSDLDKVTLDQLGKTLDRASRTMTALLASIAAVSLIVGGIGIMNIMLLSVTERTREIGIRRAVGARAEDVMQQFLMEAVTLSLSGGVLGILIGVAASGSITKLVQWSTTISPIAVLLSFGISAGVGIAFGYYPAREASRVTPMTSLRYE